MNRFRLECNRSMLVRGCLMVLLGVLCPLLMTTENLGIYADLQSVLLSGDVSLLLWLALRLVFLNSLRAIPHYLGAFMISDSLTLYVGGRRSFSLNILLTPSLILLVYNVIYWIYHIHYDFSWPAMLLVMFVLFLSYIHLLSSQFFNKLLLLSTLLFMVQCLDVAPSLTPYGFGRGEISRDVKVAAHIYRVEPVLDQFILAICFSFLFCVFVQVLLLAKDYRLRKAEAKQAAVEQELHQTQLQALRLRSFSEVQFLVHDLKSPLTTMQGLVSLSAMMEQDPRISEYLERISDATTNMNEMISEILYEERKSEVPTGELLNTALANAAIHIPPDIIRYTNDCPGRPVLCNLVRLARAIANPLDNASQALRSGEGHIDLTVEGLAEQHRIRITVRDDGIGMAADELARIWDPGFSRSKSTGLGMSFIRQVVEAHGGTIRVQSRKGLGTAVTIELEEYTHG